MIRLPVKFEAILKSGELSYGPLILAVDEDLRRFEWLQRFAASQDSGLLAVMSGRPGRGKTTAAYAASSLLNSQYRSVLPVPAAHTLALRDVPRWIHENAIAIQPDKRALPIIIDGRESTDDSQGLKDVMSAINQAVRGRPDLIFLWPTTDPSWAASLVESARTFGSRSLCPDNAVFEVSGPSKDQWIDAVNLVFDQLGTSWDEFGMNQQSAAELVDDHDTLGDFLTGLNEVRVEQETIAQGVLGLPELVVVVSSHSSIVTEVSRLRNPATYKARTDELLAASRGDARKFWVARGARQKENLAWASALLKMKIVSVTPSTVAHAVGSYTTDPTLKRLLEDVGFNSSRGTGKNAFLSTDLSRYLQGSPVPEIVASNKGKTTQLTIQAYDAIQSRSARHHREINRCLLELARYSVALSDDDDIALEVPIGEDAQADARLTRPSGVIHLEFHHLSGARCKPAYISKYVLEKAKTYAVAYNLVAR